ncbi:TPA: hypothetical protein ACWXAD_004940 [Klebsiella quasipneumoniae subsp. similipneumoniae]
MTTDITELAQSLKAAAENAIGAHERLAAYPYGEIIDISQHEGEQIDIDITDLNEFNKEANPVNILALVEALEKAQAKADIYDMLRDDYGLREKGVGLVDFVDWQANRIADLEFRIATVSRGEVLVTVDGLTDCAMSADVGKQEISLHGKMISNGQDMPSVQPAPVMDERKSFESFMAERFGDSVDRRRARNGDQGYMAWDMVVAWIVWQARATFQSGNAPEYPDAEKRIADAVELLKKAAPGMLAEQGGPDGPLVGKMKQQSK